MSNEGRDGELKILIRRVTTLDSRNVADLFKTFDHEKYGHLRPPEFDADPEDIDDPIPLVPERALVGLRIDDKGGIYLQPQVGTNVAYFKSYVAEDLDSHRLVGYVLFFHALDDKSAAFGSSEDPVGVVEDLFVEPEYRGRGIGTQLLRKVLKSSLERGCLSLECLLLTRQPDGVTFWKRRIGDGRVSAVLKRAELDRKRREMRQRLNLAALDGDTGEVVLELDRDDMRKVYERTEGAIDGKCV